MDEVELVRVLAGAGCVAPDEEAEELLAAARGDRAVLRRLVERRVTGEPLAWVTGQARFCGHAVTVYPGVYVPRWQSEPLAQRAVELLPPAGLGVDLATGSGAIALTMARARPGARVLATDIDPLACSCAAANGVEVFEGHLAGPLPPDVHGAADVVTAVVPYVPTEALSFLPRDVRAFEPARALDGGPAGLSVLQEAISASAGLLRAGGSLLLEVGGEQAGLLGSALSAAGFGPVRSHFDDDGELRSLESELLTPAR